MENWPTAPYAYPAPVTTPLPDSPQDAQPVAPQTQPKRRRMWPVLLTLYFLSPLIAEVLSGSTPPLLFIQPFGFIFIPLLYGSSAILIREILVRRRLGWGNALVLGAAFGVFQEALVVQTWYTFMAKSSPSHSNGFYGVWLGTNWVWALDLTIYHAVISITIPLIWLTLIFPQRALLPGLRRRGVILFLLWLIIPCGLLALNAAKAQFAKEGYAGPPLIGYLLACALMVTLILVGGFARFPTPRPQPGRRAPGVWAVRGTMFGLTTLFFVLSFILPATKLPPPVMMAIAVGVFSFGVWRIARWSACDGWSARHWLALVMGLVAWYLLLWAPLVEFAFRLPEREGLTLANLIAMIALFVFDWRLKRRLANPTPLTPTAVA
ncbi:MAG TPA: hypothetical protein VMV29_05140 [Ktedonobacterales bacterium]|nr:hypothetical protein [Ktedonobacterales bacterium]